MAALNLTYDFIFNNKIIELLLLYDAILRGSNTPIAFVNT